MPRYSDSDFIYFIRQANTGFIKIGRTAKVGQRLANLQVGSPHWLKVVAAIPNLYGFNEKAIHERFKKHWFRGEWHHEREDLSTFIEKHIPWFVKKSGPILAGDLVTKELWIKRCERLLPYNSKLEKSIPEIMKMPGLSSQTLAQRITIGMARIAKREALRAQEAANR